MGRVKAMTDAELAELGVEYKRLRTEEKAAGALADEAKDRIIAELDRRKTTSVEITGVTLTRKAKSMRLHDVTALKLRVARRIFGAVTKTVVDLKAWDAAVKVGEIPADVVADIETRTESAPYVDVTLAAAAAA